MKTAERKRSSSGPSTSHKKCKSEWNESFVRDLEAVENKAVTILMLHKQKYFIKEVKI